MTELKLTAETYLHDGFGSVPAFGGLVADEQSAVVGHLLCNFDYDSDNAALISHITDPNVDRGAQRRGIGRALMAEVAMIARAGGAREVIWSVYHANIAAAAFYEGA